MTEKAVRTMKKLGIILPSITDLLQSEMIEGVCQYAFPHGYDVIVLTNTTHTDALDSPNEHAISEENIYSLIENGVFDGVIYVSQYFHKEELQERIVSMIRAAGIPCAEIGDTVPEFAHFKITERQAIADMTEHLITVHGCRDLCCLTGPDHIPEAQERLAGFLDAAQKHGIDIPEDHIIYGDFWKFAGGQLGRDIAAGKRPKPQAIVCTSDMMAVSLCDALTEGGVSVPEEVIVTGFDAHLEALSHFPSITTVGGQSREMGRLAAGQLCAMIEGTPLPQDTSHLKLIFGASCGCLDRSEDYRQAAKQVQRFIRDAAHKTQMLEMQTNSNFISGMSEAQSFHELIETADRTTHIITRHTGLDLCLCADWEGDVRHPDRFRSKGYPPEMLLALANRIGANEPAGYNFPTAELTPSLRGPHEPALLFVMPIHQMRQVLGYCVISYEKDVQFQLTTLLPNWLDAVANGLRTLQKKRYTDYLHEKVEEASLHDVMTGLLSRKGLLRQLESDMQTGQQGLLLVTIGRLLAVAPDRDADAFTFVQAEILIANALQLMSGPTRYPARLDGTHFALAFSMRENERLDAVTEQLVTQLDLFLRKMQESPAYAYFPEVVYDSCIVADASKGFLAERVAVLDEKAAQSAGRRTADAGQLERLHRELHLAPQLDWTLPGMAKALCISVSYLQKRYKQAFGIGFMEDLIEARIEKAKHLLTATDLRIGEIAEQCGYRNASHFMRQFRDKTGMTPSAFRENR